MMIKEPKLGFGWNKLMDLISFNIYMYNSWN